MKIAVKMIVTVMLLLPVFGENAVAQSSVEVTLAGYKMVPLVHSPGSGVLTVTLRSDTLFVEGSFQDLRGFYRSSSIHYGSTRESGHRLLGLRVRPDEDRKGGEFLVEQNAFALRPSLLEALGDGRLYIIVASDRFQHGEMRGQIPPMR